MPPLPLVAALLLAGLIWPPAARAAGSWRAPVDGRVVARFHYARAHPFAAGQRRGAEFAAAPRSPVVAPCGGRVVFAGNVPRFGGAVTIRCRDGLVATVLELVAASVRRGTPVLPGRPLGAVGAAGRLGLGARRASDRFGYRDPLVLIGPPDRPPLPALPLRPTLGPAPRGGARPVRPRQLAPARAARPTAARSPGPSELAAPGPSGPAPLAAWFGAGLVATALAGGGTARIARRQRAARRSRPALSRTGGGG
jgi:hypothetical protein